MASFFTETEKLYDFLMRLVPVDLADAAQHSKTGPTLPTEAPRVADVLMCTLVIERIGQQQNRLLKSEFLKKCYITICTFFHLWLDIL